MPPSNPQGEDPDTPGQAAGPPLSVEGPSFPLTVKLLATAMVAALLVSAAPLLGTDISAWDPWVKLAMGTGVMFVGAGYWTILSSATGVQGERIYQTGLLRKEICIREITQLRLVSIPGLRWLIVPRLVARAGFLKSYSFPTADPRVLEAFRLLAYGEPAPAQRDPS